MEIIKKNPGRTFEQVERELEQARKEHAEFRAAIENATRMLAGNLADEKLADSYVRAQAKERAAELRVSLLEQDRRHWLPMAIADGYRKLAQQAADKAAAYEAANADFQKTKAEAERAIKEAQQRALAAMADLSEMARQRDGHIQLRCWQETEDMDKAEQLEAEVKAILADTASSAA